MGVLDGIKLLALARAPPAELPGVMRPRQAAAVLTAETPAPDRPRGPALRGRARHRAGAPRARARRGGPAGGRRVPRQDAVAPRRDAEHALLLLGRPRPAPRRGVPRGLVPLLRDLRDARRQAPDDRLHRALALGELLQPDRPARAHPLLAPPPPLPAHPHPPRRR